MSCFASCMARPPQYHHLENRMTKAPVKFDKNQLEELKKKFSKVASYRQEITKDSFKKNMGILGLHCAQQFSERLFNSIDIDNDDRVSFQDFVEYMEVLKCGSDKHKARISYKLIAKKDASKITIKDFKQFLNDFFLSWSSITNISITKEIKERTNQYVSFIFNKVKRETGSDDIDAKYYMEKLYKDKDFMESFEFITQGMANIFITDKITDSDSDPAAVLYKTLKQLHAINDTIFEMTNEESIYFEPTQVEEIPKQIPNYPPKFINTNHNKIFRNSDATSANIPENSKYQNKERNNMNEETGTHEQTQRYPIFSSSKESCESHDWADNSNKVSMLEKKLSFIKDKVQHLISETKSIFSTLSDKFEGKREEYTKGKQGVIKNVHRRIKKAEGQMIFIGDDNWNLVLNMMIGIQMAVRSVKGFQEMIYEEPKDFGLKYYFELIPRRFGDQDNNSTIYSFTDYAPNTFNHIRKIFKIDNEDYIASIGPNRLMASLMMGEVSSMTSLTSQGKSGSFFYYTSDGKYMLKTISYREYKFLRSILEDYYYYLKKNPDSLITKFFGLHKLIQKNGKGDQTCRSYFVIMANVFNTKERIVQRYDLKGSTYGRKTDDHDPMATKKDNDFVEREPLFLEEDQREALLSIIKRDAQFFEKHQIIDYSLLIGVIRKSQSDMSSLRNTSESKLMKEEEQNFRETRAFISKESNESYIFGIIDILTLYDSRKVFEYYFKRVFYGEGISAVPPDDYKERFVNFIERDVFALKKEKMKESQFQSVEKVKK